jgi:uncharacterized Zn finger protein (UPF0148 family)
MMTRVCAWCKAVLGEKPGEGITHTICPKCRAEFCTSPAGAKTADIGRSATAIANEIHLPMAVGENETLTSGG